MIEGIVEQKMLKVWLRIEKEFLSLNAIARNTPNISRVSNWCYLIYLFRLPTIDLNSTVFMEYGRAIDVYNVQYKCNKVDCGSSSRFALNFDDDDDNNHGEK